MTRAPDAREGTTDAPTTNALAVDIHAELPEALEALPLAKFVGAHRRARRHGAEPETAKPIAIDTARLPTAETEARR